ncbi:MAG: aminotransferase class IV [Candidatus Roizmanbacteria bacterium]
MENTIHFLNGKFVPETELLISPRDLGYMRGYAVADFIVTHNHHVIKLRDHVQRLFRSAQVIGLHIPWTTQQLEDWIRETIKRNDVESEITLKTIISGGVSKSLTQAETPTIVIIVDRYRPHPSEYYEKGVKAITVDFQRSYPAAKHTNYIEAIRQRAKMDKNDVTDIIYHEHSRVTEGAGNNIFAVIHNILVTTKTNIIEGITRNILLEILHLPIPIEVRDISLAELATATEVFLTGSGRGVIGVVKIDDNTVGNGIVGPITREVAKQYDEYMQAQISDGQN